MNIFLNILGTSKCFSVDEKESVAKALTGMQLPRNALLHHQGRVIHANCSGTFHELAIKDCSTLTLSIPLKGGAAKCQLESCSERVARLTGACRWCQSEFCSKHRLPESHECANISGCRQQSQQKNSDKLMNGKCVADKV